MNAHLINHNLLLFAQPHFLQFIEIYGPIGIYIWFLTFDNLTPIPAEISLLIVGYIAAHGAFNFAFAAFASFAGLISVDIIYFLLTKTGNKFVMKIFRKRKGKFLEKYKAKMKTKLPQTLILLIFIPRMRMFGPILAALSKCSFRRFIFYDAIGLIGFVLLFVSLGVLFHNSLEKLISEVDALRHWIFAGFVAVVTAIIIIVIAKRRSAE